MDDIVKFVRDLGFPAAVAFFVLWRVDGSMRDLRDVIGELIAEIRAERKARAESGGS